MPQFDFYSFPVQTLWTLLGFAYTYFFVTYHVIPRFSEVFQMRFLFKNLVRKASVVSSKTRYDKALNAVLTSYK